MKTASIVAVVSVLITATSALAQTAAQRAACTPDVWRLCATEIPNVEAIKSCLRRERQQLGAACRVVMDTADRPVQTVAVKR